MNVSNSASSERYPERHKFFKKEWKRNSYHTNLFSFYFPTEKKQLMKPFHCFLYINKKTLSENSNLPETERFFLFYIFPIRHTHTHAHVSPQKGDLLTDRSDQEFVERKALPNFNANKPNLSAGMRISKRVAPREILEAPGKFPGVCKRKTRFRW